MYCRGEDCVVAGADGLGGDLSGEGGAVFVDGVAVAVAVEVLFAYEPCLVFVLR